MVPKIIRPDGANSISLYDVMFRYGIGSEESDSLSMLEVTIPPRTLVKPQLFGSPEAARSVTWGRYRLPQGPWPNTIVVPDSASAPEPFPSRAPRTAG